MSTPPTLSVCLIVKDEEAMLPGCLASVRDLADEIVVVDTGSADRTVELARAAGAVVRHHQWTDHFAAARNVSLEAATGDFVLVLDADERLDPAATMAIRAIMAADPADGPPTIYLPLIDNRDAAGNALGADHMPRLWRHRPTLRFTGRIHEQVGVGVPGLRTAFDDRVRIVHLGYDPQHAEARGKRARNRRLLEAERAARPDDAVVAFYLAKEDYAAGDDATALAGFRVVIAAGEPINLSLSATLFATECLRHLGRIDEALDTARAGLERAPSYGGLWFAAGQAALEGGRPDEALALLQNAHRAPTGYAATAFRDPSIAEWRADLTRARAHALRGDLAPATRLFAAVRDRLPVDARLGADLDAADVALARRDPEGAWALLEPHLSAAPADAAEPLLKLIQLAIETVGLAGAYQLLLGALSGHPPLLHQLPLVGAAAEIAEALGDPNRGQWLHICTLLDSPHPEHYAALAEIKAAQGAHDEANALRAEAAKRGG